MKLSTLAATLTELSRTAGDDPEVEVSNGPAEEGREITSIYMTRSGNTMKCRIFLDGDDVNA